MRWRGLLLHVIVGAVPVIIVAGVIVAEHA
jgi:hypothetical protein